MNFIDHFVNDLINYLDDILIDPSHEAPLAGSH
jgi:hypothetical protein